MPTKAMLLFLSLIPVLQHLLPFLFQPFASLTATAAPVGICYGRISSSLPPEFAVVNLIESNNVTNIRLFDADSTTLQSFSGTGIKLMIGIPNNILPSLATGATVAALDWLQSNVFSIIPADQVRYIAVGNEVFLDDPYYSTFVVPAILNLYQALQNLGLSETIKLSSPQAASILSHSYPPSSGTFDPSVRSTIIPLLQFLQESRSPLMVNVYPYITHTNNKRDVPLDYALFQSDIPVYDGELVYENLFDASIDAFVWAMEKEGFGDVAVLVAETGWPTSGGQGASVENAWAYNENVVKRALSDVGSPKRPGLGVEVYLFGLFDEDGKGGEEYEKHFGIFGVNGVKIYNLNFD